MQDHYWPNVEETVETKKTGSPRSDLFDIVLVTLQFQDIEEALIKKDIRKHKLQELHDQPSALDKVARMNDPVMIRSRGKLMLPAPQISELELQHIAKMGGDLGVDPDLAEGAGGEATRRLLGQYDQTPTGYAIYISCIYSCLASEVTHLKTHYLV